MQIQWHSAVASLAPVRLMSHPRDANSPCPLCPALPACRYVLWPRIDQKTCLKAIQAAGFEPLVIPMRLEGEQLVTDVEALRQQVEELGAAAIACILTTTRGAGGGGGGHRNCHPASVCCRRCYDAAEQAIVTGSTAHLSTSALLCPPLQWPSCASRQASPTSSTTPTACSLRRCAPRSAPPGARGAWMPWCRAPTRISKCRWGEPSSPRAEAPLSW